MRQPQHFSPTGLQTFYENRDEYYLKYLADNKPPNFAQTKPMSIGSSFDAYIKSYLYEKLFGAGADPKFAFQTLFEAQVEPHNRDWAIIEGKNVFEQYKVSGALSDLMLDLGNAIGTPKFELEVKGVINGMREGVTRTIAEVPLLGKPDLFYINKFGAHVIFDWKVNGYCSNYPVSPMKGYVRLRDAGINKGQHKDAQLMSHNGVMINIAGHLETFNEQWATQLSIYAWLCGQDIGSDFIVAVDQVVCKPNGARPILRFAEHRLKCSAKFQYLTFTKAIEAWDIINSDHIFRDLTIEESQAKCKLLDGVATGLIGDGSPEDEWFKKAMRG